jgi:hypothetical protein
MTSCQSVPFGTDVQSTSLSQYATLLDRLLVSWPLQVVAACERSLAAKEARLKQIEALPAWRWGISAAEQSALRESIKNYLVRAHCPLYALKFLCPQNDAASFGCQL